MKLFAISFFKIFIILLLCPIIIILSLVLFGELNEAVTRPSAEKLESYAEEKYQKDFEYIRSFELELVTPASHEEKEKLRAIELKDEESGIEFVVYAWCSEWTSWQYVDTYHEQALAYCAENSA